jgi:hypothetical protein
MGYGQGMRTTTARAARLAALVPPRAFVAELQMHNGGKITTTIHGPTPHAAEILAERSIPGVARVIVRGELPNH